MLKLPRDNFVLLETNKFDRDNQRTFLFTNPLKIISCYKSEDVKGALGEIEHFVLQGYYASGFISYEAGFTFEESLKDLQRTSDFPLVWFGVYKRPKVTMHKQKLDFLSHTRSSYAIKNLRPNISKKEYVDSIEQIKELIRKGQTYQVNYTFKYRFDFDGEPHSFYKDLKEKQSVRYSALIKTPDFSLVSLSPELFFRKRQNSIEVRPMKGTIERGKTLGEDTKNIDVLKNSLKNRSENVMIVDLLRNDLGRISESGNVKTVKLFEVEKYETLLQMISIIRSRLKKGVGIYDLFKAIFPSGSVTGAPKISTMKIINSLEKEPRNVYTGSIGFFSPYAKEAIFNVAIRTILISHKTGKAEMGIGSGIVYDSDSDKEFEESKLKAKFMIEKKNDFKLIETILWQPKKGYFLLSLHLDRLFSSARYFDFNFDKKYIALMLKKLEKSFDKNPSYRVRLLMDKGGSVEFSHTKIDKMHNKPKVRFSDKKVKSCDIFLYHKTTNRALYDEEYNQWKEKGYFDIVFTNEKNQVTEGSISNIIIKKRSFYYTPPIECGLLNGVYRRYLFKNKRFPIREKILYKKDIENADKVYMINSVRGMVGVIYDKR